MLPLLLGLPSCGNKIANQEEVESLKALLAKQDLSPIYDKMFVALFTQKYDVFSRRHDEGDEQTRFYSYRGAGGLGCLYEIEAEAFQEAEALENPDFFDYLSRGLGSYQLMQTATVVSYDFDSEEEEIAPQEIWKNDDFFQQVEARFTQTDVQVSNALLYRDKTTDEYHSEQSFNGIIDKGLLFDAITVRTFSDIFARTNLYDGARCCETLDRIYFDVVRGLTRKSDEELIAFIAKNNIEIEENEENTLLHFKIEDEELRDALDAHEIIPGAFEGTLTYEKESGSFDAYDYHILYLVDERDPASGNINSATMEFSASGYSKNEKYGSELYITPNPKVYDDAEEFLEDVVNQVIPPMF